jgi:sugar/nucleoside kinase (ribokinase family)
VAEVLIMKKVLIAGEINVDLVLQGYESFPAPGQEVLVDDFAMVLGSASAICAMGLARLGNAVAFSGKVGKDPWGAFCLEAMTSAGIDVSRVVSDPAIKTGVTVSISSAEDRALVSYLGSISSLTADDVDSSHMDGCAHLHVSSYFLQEGLRPGCRDLLKRASDLGLSTSLDPGFDPAERWEKDLLETLEQVDLFFPNEVEIRALTGCLDATEGLGRLENGRTRTVAKLGRDGATCLENGQPVHVPAFRVEPVDTTGAGDSFNSGFLHAWLREAAIEDCLRFGAACGALSTLGSGGTSSQPTVEQAEELIRTRSG